LNNLFSEFTAIARSQPHSDALVYWNHRQISYGDLLSLAKDYSSVISRDLLDSKPGVIAIFNDRSPKAYAVMLACIDLGLTYVNLDYLNPTDRLQNALVKCAPRLVFDFVGTWNKLDKFSRGYERVLSLENVYVAKDPEVPAGRLPKRETLESDPAYLVFTSGSTGAPKAVCISRENVAGFVNWIRDFFKVDPADRLSSVNPPYFDNSVFDFYASLWNGATLCIFPDAKTDSITLYADLVEEYSCTRWFSVPSLLMYLNRLGLVNRSKWRAVEQVIFGGEGYPLVRLRELKKNLPSTTSLTNVYGPSECTCICSATEVTRTVLESDLDLPPIGRMAAGFCGSLKDVVDGVGELVLRGPRVGLGYYRDQKQTAEKFELFSEGGEYLERSYKTGDLMCQDEVGNFHFVGRKDRQVKIMGHRIELEEIENAILQIQEVDRCVVIAEVSLEEHRFLVAYVELRQNQPVDENYLRKELQGIVPQYMIPRDFRIVEALPQMNSGKLDRTSLQIRAG